jgi:GT2 family glycosyltransferase
MDKHVDVSGRKVVVVIPNWNGVDSLRKCLDSVLAQSLQPHIIVVDNGSVDDSVKVLEAEYPMVEIVRHDVNKGYAGGVNPGFRLAIQRGNQYVAPFNNDAVADKRWLEHLVAKLDHQPSYGIATCKILSIDGGHLDSTGDYYTIWGLPYPRGRGETDTGKYDAQTEIFGGSGGASLYRTAMLKEIGLLDEDFFAYYEDVDLSFRAQLYGWKVVFVPQSRVYHEISTTSRRIKGFFTYQTVKNYPLLFWKNVPAKLLWRVGPRLALAQTLFIGRAVQRKHAWYALKALAVSLWLTPKKLGERHHIQQARRQHNISTAYINSILVHDLPPNAHALRKLRGYWQGFRGSRDNDS